MDDKGWGGGTSSLVFCSKLSLLSTVSSTANSHVLNVVRHLENKKTLMSTNIITAYHMLLKKTLSDVIYPNVSVLPGLLLEVVLAVQGVVGHQTI